MQRFKFLRASTFACIFPRDSCSASPPRRYGSVYAAGSLRFPIRKVNNIFYSDTMLLSAYLSNREVHQEQEAWPIPRGTHSILRIEGWRSSVPDTSRCQHVCFLVVQTPERYAKTISSQ